MGEALRIEGLTPSSSILLHALCRKNQRAENNNNNDNYKFEDLEGVDHIDTNLRE